MYVYIYIYVCVCVCVCEHVVITEKNQFSMKNHMVSEMIYKKKVL